jgi:hypothetical protein
MLAASSILFNKATSEGTFLDAWLADDVEEYELSQLEASHI